MVTADITQTTTELSPPGGKGLDARLTPLSAVRHVTVSIAEVGIRCCFTDPHFAEGVAKAYEPFLSQAEPAAQMDISIIPWSEVHDNPTSHELRYEPGIFTGGGISCKIDRDIRTASVAIAPDLKLFDIALRAVLSLLLPRHEGMLIHAAAVSTDRQGYLFPGRSESGKSTVSRLSLRAGKRVLTDELPAMRRIDNVWHVCGTPFRGECESAGQPGLAPLQSVVTLHKAAELSTRPLPVHSTVAKLLGCTMNFSQTTRSSALLLDLVSDLVLRTDCRELSFRKDDTIWDVL